ncbi:MAG: lytic transglycosylase domain-containing protein [Alphaproteobacteria bacterium]|nr:lytic transglycosylase domain-containing protein [Alphaproteobacteria bacterium]MBU1516654.1 lytic transglycosylase domain-containing protein [Alphaproteobacteria bacterium]MBU2094410.1 lytic transglycosylase domain-containing protein [Alphaproteobacteria bacterium]MBU2152637.1 lytic transglycosylase domain-containing protein [Alphaproteobacteria bacterium]MBU2307582.1 lytic transglycosylase domain-containing protein [Alphaproteobacteria bacterium]
MQRSLTGGVAAICLMLGPVAHPAGATTLATESLADGPPADCGASSAQLSSALVAARRGDLSAAQRGRAALCDPIDIKLVDWALADAAGSKLSTDELQAMQAALRGWAGERHRAGLLAARTSARLADLDAPDDTERTRDYRARRQRMGLALRGGDARSAYASVTGHAQRPGSVAYAELESFAGWLALTKLRDASAAERHFGRLDTAVRTPVSKARAAYWRGRAAEQAGDKIGAQLAYVRGARYVTTFYGQLAAEKAGLADLVLTPDPRPSVAERLAFENAATTRALSRLAVVGDRTLLRRFALQQADQVRGDMELALLVDALKSLGETEVSLLAYRRGARLGYVLYERGYPLAPLPATPGGAEPALVLAITRQESQFDPRVRSHAGARGMMQILPSTGRQVARRVGLAWRDDLLWDAAANMQLGSRYLGDLTEGFGGSYVLAAAGYNAGPGRPRAWVGVCGDPTSAPVDPIDFIECIPFGETRDYVMNVLSNYQVYRARLNGGHARLTASEALRTPGAARATELD